jgi:hypothetical protein
VNGVVVYPRFGHITPDVVAACVVTAEVCFVYLLFIFTFFFENLGQPLPAIIKTQFFDGEFSWSLDL